MQKMISKATIISGILLVLLLVSGQTIAQRGGEDNQAGRDDDRPRRQRFDPETIRQRMNQWMKDMIQADDESWTVIQPRMEKVFDLNRQLMGRRFGFGGRRGGPNQGRPDNAEVTPLEQAQQDLRTLLEQPEASPEAIKAQLDVLRKARQQIKQQLLVAQQELRELLTLKQEAQLVMIGTLE